MTSALRLLALAPDPRLTQWTRLREVLSSVGLRPRTVAEETLPEILPEDPSEGRLAAAGAPACRVGVYDLPPDTPPETVAVAEYRAGLAGWSAETTLFRPRRRRLLVMDADSTLLRQEVIDEIAAHAGLKEEVADITARAMAGELDFAQSLAQRVALLQGLDASLLEQVAAELQLTAGARELVQSFRAQDWPVCVVSGGFTRILEPVGRQLDLTRVRANGLAVDAQGRLTGSTEGPVVDAEAKERSLRGWADEFGVDPEDVLAVGDGANDIRMVRRAGTGVAFCAKRALRTSANLRVPVPRLDILQYFVRD